MATQKKIFIKTFFLSNNDICINGWIFLLKMFANQRLCDLNIFGAKDPKIGGKCQ